MIYNQGQTLKFKVDNQSGHIEIQPTLLDYFKCMGILFGGFTLIYWVIQIAVHNS